MSLFFLLEIFFDLCLFGFFAFLELFDRLDDLFKAFFFLLFFSLDDEVDEVKDDDELSSELEILDEELDWEAELLDEERDLRFFTFWLGFLLELAAEFFVTVFGSEFSRWFSPSSSFSFLMFDILNVVLHTSSTICNSSSESFTSLTFSYIRMKQHELQIK